MADLLGARRTPLALQLARQCPPADERHRTARILAEDDEILAENLPQEIVRASQQLDRVEPLEIKPDLETVNRLHVQSVYEKNQRNKSRTARVLGIGRRSLYRLLEKYGID